MAIKKISKEEANLTTWFLNQINLLESQTGKAINTLDLQYIKDDGVGVGLTHIEETPETPEA